MALNKKYDRFQLGYLRIKGKILRVIEHVDEGVNVDVEVLV